MSLFVDNLNALRGDLSVNAFAKKIGVLQGTLNNYMHGREPSVDFVIKVCKACNVSSDWLLGLDSSRGISAVNSAVAIGGGNISYNSCDNCPLLKAASDIMSRRNK